MKKFLDNYGYLIITFFVFLLFGYISICTPLCGDDWGYCLNGQNGHPIQMAFQFYQTWSGRFFSELYGFFVAPKKWLWNILNPLLFASIYYFIYKLIDAKRNQFFTALTILAVMLSVNDELRMQTYSWIMGTTYVIPLCLSLIYFYIVYDVQFNEGKHKTLKLLLSNLLLFYIGLTMENIAAMMIVAVLAICIFSFIKNKKVPWLLLINLIVSVVSFMIMRSSPGSEYRLLRDNAEWNELSIIEKIINGYPDFIYYTFIKNNYLIFFLSVFALFNVWLSDVKGFEKLIHSLIMIIGTFAVFSFVIIKDNNFFIDKNSLFSKIFWIIYVVDIFFIICRFLKGTNKILGMFALCFGGGCNLVMLFSPIFGARSSLYLVYYMIIVIGVLINNILEYNVLLYILSIVVLIVIGDRTIEYITKYYQVKKAQEERLTIVQYYVEHPEEKEAWIPRFPIYSVHSSDVEPDDTYHLETFKSYYGLPQEAENIIFYYK